MPLSLDRGVEFGSSINVRSKEGSDMLVLSRKLGEKIFINDNICITVVDIDRGKIRLGIEAPREIPIFRKELLTADAAPPAAGSSLEPAKK
jgi:carbon storage regulator